MTLFQPFPPPPLPPGGLPRLHRPVSQFAAYRADTRRSMVNVSNKFANVLIRLRTAERNISEQLRVLRRYYRRRAASELLGKKKRRGKREERRRATRRKSI